MRSYRVKGLSVIVCYEMKWLDEQFKGIYIRRKYASSYFLREAKRNRYETVENAKEAAIATLISVENVSLILTHRHSYIHTHIFFLYICQEVYTSIYTYIIPEME